MFPANCLLIVIEPIRLRLFLSLLSESVISPIIISLMENARHSKTLLKSSQMMCQYPMSW